MLKEHGKDLKTLTMHKGKTTPLCRAVYLERKNVVEMLVKHGANVNQCSSDGKTPIMWAAMKGNMRIVTFLAEDCRADLEVRDQNGFNVFDICVHRINYSMARYFFTRYYQRPIGKDLRTRQKYVTEAGTEFDFELFIHMLEEGDTSSPTKEKFFEKKQR
jgi:ankyrin repeat protein